MKSLKTERELIQESIRLLGISIPFTYQDLKTAFKQAARVHHPDVNGGDSTSFIRIKDAYEYLSENLDKLEDHHQGEDIEVNVELNWDEFLNGCSKTIECRTRAQKSLCPTCKGTGEKPKTRISKCMTCNGRGFSIQNQSDGTTSQRICDDCIGLGKIKLGKCNKCDGTGFCHLEWKTDLSIPSGLLPNTLIKYKQRGAPGNPYGDLILRINVTAQPPYKLDSSVLTKTVGVNFAHVALGKSIVIQDPYGNSHVISLQSLKSRNCITLNNAGAIGPNGERSPLRIELNAKIPTQLSHRSLLLLQDLCEEWDMTNDL